LTAEQGHLKPADDLVWHIPHILVLMLSLRVAAAAGPKLSDASAILLATIGLWGWAALGVLHPKARGMVVATLGLAVATISYSEQWHPSLLLLGFVVVLVGWMVVMKSPIEPSQVE
jgi:hypothetical protein